MKTPLQPAQDALKNLEQALLISQPSESPGPTCLFHLLSTNPNAKVST